MSIRTHELKTWSAPFGRIWSGMKTCEVRRVDDRHFQIGDTLILIEMENSKETTGRRIYATVTDITTSAGPYALMGIRGERVRNVIQMAALSIRVDRCEED